MPTRLSSLFLRINQHLPLLIALLGSGISLVLTVRLCLELRGEGDWIAAAIGVCLESAKLSFAALGCSLLLAGGSSKLGHRFGGLLLCSLALVLTATSLAASLGYFLQADGRQRTQAMLASRAYRDAQADVAQLDRQSELLARHAEADTEASYRTRAAESLRQLDALSLRRQSAEARLTRLESAPSTLLRQQEGLLSGIAELTGVDLQRTRLGAFGIISALLELVALAAYLIVRSQATGNAARGGKQTQLCVVDRQPSVSPLVEVKRQRRPAAERRATSTRRRPAERADTGTRQHKTRYERVKELVASGKLQPNVRALKQQCAPLGDRVASRYLHAMVGEGLLRREGQGYVLQAT
jgi:hypothetical protein